MTARKAKKPLILVFGMISVLIFSITTNSATYQVRPGDSLYLISRSFGQSIDSILLANNLRSNLIYPGQLLVIPSSGNTSSSRYTVQPGDSLYLIALRNNLSVSELRQANNLWTNEIRVGQVLTLPTTGQAPPPANSGNTYTVRPGDSIYQIATRYGITVNQLRVDNNLYNNTIYPGQQLVIGAAQNSPPSSGGGSSSAGFSASELDLLARLVRAEAEGEPYQGMVAVAATVLNRVSDSRYPNSISEVIYQVTNGYYYQYSPVIDGRINLPATADAQRAVRDAINGWDPTYGAIGFYNPFKTTNQWVRSHPVTITIGEHVFFRN